MKFGAERAYVHVYVLQTEECMSASDYGSRRHAFFRL